MNLGLLPKQGCEPAKTRKTAAKPWEIDGLWARIEPLLPVVRAIPDIQP
jgi:hypothetical protein